MQIRSDGDQKCHTEGGFQNYPSLSPHSSLAVGYSCSWQREILVQGHLYITANWICFYSNILGWESKVGVHLFLRSSPSFSLCLPPCLPPCFPNITTWYVVLKACHKTKLVVQEEIHQICSLVPRPSHRPVFDHLQYANWRVGRSGNRAIRLVEGHTATFSTFATQCTTLTALSMASLYGSTLSRIVAAKLAVTYRIVGNFRGRKLS